MLQIWKHTCIQQKNLRRIHLNIDDVIPHSQIEVLLQLKVVIVNPLAHAFFVERLPVSQENKNHNIEMEQNFV